MLVTSGRATQGISWFVKGGNAIERHLRFVSGVGPIVLATMQQMQHFFFKTSATVGCSILQFLFLFSMLLT